MSVICGENEMLPNPKKRTPEKTYTPIYPLHQLLIPHSLVQTNRKADRLTLLTGNAAEAFLTLPVIMVFALRPE